MSGALAAFFGGHSTVTATISPSSATATGSTTSLTTNSVTCSVTGGTASAYSWSFSSGGTDITIMSPSSATTTFRQTGGGSGDFTGAAICTVTVGGVPVVSSNSASILIERV